MERNYNTPKKAGLLACMTLAFAGCSSMPGIYSVESKEAETKVKFATYIVTGDYKHLNRRVYQEMKRMADTTHDGRISNAEADNLLEVTLRVMTGDLELPPLPDTEADEGLMN